MSKLEITIIYGPPASGKSLNKEALMEHFGCGECFDLGFQDKDLASASGKVIVFMTHFPTCKPPRGLKKIADSWGSSIIIPISYAKSLLGERWVEPVKNPPLGEMLKS